jgi:hypothetical protein
VLIGAKSCTHDIGFYCQNTYLKSFQMSFKSYVFILIVYAFGSKPTIINI